MLNVNKFSNIVYTISVLVTCLVIGFNPNPEIVNPIILCVELFVVAVVIKFSVVIFDEKLMKKSTHNIMIWSYLVPSVNISYYYLFSDKFINLKNILVEGGDVYWFVLLVGFMIIVFRLFFYQLVEMIMENGNTAEISKKKNIEMLKDKLYELDETELENEMLRFSKKGDNEKASLCLDILNKKFNYNS